MTTAGTDPKQRAASFLNYLRKLKDDRGAMAELRRALNPAQRYRAWPLLAPFGGIDDPRFEIVAGLFAYHPEETQTGNLGSTCLQLNGEHKTFEARFKRLLSCERADVFKHIRPIILAARSKGIRVNYEQLFVDLSFWGDVVKARWAAEFWGSAEVDVAS